MKTYKFDRETKEFLYAEEAFLDPLETEQQGQPVYLLPADSTFTAPLESKDGYAVVWNGEAWESIEDHRPARDKGGVIMEGSGTPYWLPGDTYESPARSMTELGPLPKGAMLMKPEKPAAVLAAELQASYTQVIQQALDDFARTRSYDHINSACTYATSTDPQFRLEGEYCVALRDTTWRTGYRLLDEVKAGTREVPTETELLALLPVGSAKWPDEA